MNINRLGTIGWIGIAICLSIMAVEKIGEWIGLWSGM